MLGTATEDAPALPDYPDSPAVVPAAEEDAIMTSSINVDELLAAAQRSIQVDKAIPLTLDVGSLIAYDMAPLDNSKLSQNKKTDAYLKDLTRDNTQLLLNAIFSLPSSLVDKVTCVQLPAPTLHLPREKRIPPPKVPTKWESFAKSRGINKKKRGRMIYDEVSKEYRPRFGYNSAANDKDQNWVVEVPGNGDPYKDWLGEQADKKKEGVAKNQLQRLKNISKEVKQESNQISQTVKQAHLSTASLGKFQEKVKNEKKGKEKGKVKKFAPVSGDVSSEREKSLALMSKITSNSVSVNTGKAANKEMGALNKRKREEQRENRKSGRRSKAGLKVQTKHFDKKTRTMSSGPDKKKPKRSEKSER